MCGFGGNNCWWIIILVLLLVFCGGCGGGCGCDSGCGACNGGCNGGCGCYSALTQKAPGFRLTDSGGFAPDAGRTG